MALSARVEDSGQLKRLGCAWISEFDVSDSFDEGIEDNLSLIRKICLFIFAYAIVKNTGVNCPSRLIAEKQTIEDRNGLKDLILVRGYFDLELHILTESDEV